MANPHPKPGPGRRHGSKNKFGQAIKDMIAGALSDVGGQDYLARQAIENPVAFMGLIGKAMPLQVSGEDGGPVIIVTGVKRADDKD